ncbi:TlpA family protein disulfide reductase [Pedobacter sp. UBA5917]|jgi:thiol-disulfide isomerase/thioredoxin|uniref:TlpA family protein disulfide reductase n=1 Tax=Pedobacter sp. UBA5917 TaxID=1947061 RepID=UPI0025D174B3|nr:TlpA family protein disulfide reductase [Pedobacter sp. UBA5917]
MRKSIFFNVLASLCPKKGRLGVLSRQAKRSTCQSTNEIKPPQNLHLLADLSKSEIVFHRLKRKSLIRIRTLAVLLFISYSCFAQNESIEPLKIGDKLPGVILNTSFQLLSSGPVKIDSLKLSQYKDKIILFDFWASWCSTCIYKFPVMEQLQEKYKNDLVIILVDSKETRDTPERMLGILTGAKAPFKKTGLPSIYNDTILTKIFLHRYLPHYVWFGKDGTLKLISSAELLNAETVNALLSQH